MMASPGEAGWRATSGGRRQDRSDPPRRAEEVLPQPAQTSRRGYLGVAGEAASIRGTLFRGSEALYQLVWSSTSCQACQGSRALWPHVGSCAKGSFVPDARRPVTSTLTATTAAPWRRRRSPGSRWPSLFGFRPFVPSTYSSSALCLCHCLCFLLPSLPGKTATPPCPLPIAMSADVILQHL